MSVPARCSHCAGPEAMTEEQQAAFLLGKLSADLTVLACEACWKSFKKASEDAKEFDWGGRVTVMSLRKPKPIAEQPLDKVFAWDFIVATPMSVI